MVHTISYHGCLVSCHFLAVLVDFQSSAKKTTTRRDIAQTQTIKHFQMKLTSIDLISTHVYKKEIMIWNGCFWYIKFKISNKLDFITLRTHINQATMPWERESYNLLNFQGLLQTIKSCWQFYWEDYTLL